MALLFFPGIVYVFGLTKGLVGNFVPQTAREKPDGLATCLRLRHLLTISRSKGGSTSWGSFFAGQ